MEIRWLPPGLWYDRKATVLGEARPEKQTFQEYASYLVIAFCLKMLLRSTMSTSILLKSV